MATIILKDAHVSIAGNDFSDHVMEVSLEYSADEVEDTNMGDNTHQFMTGSLKDWTASITFSQDYAVGSIDDTLFALVGTEVAFVGRPQSGAVSTTNPEYTGTGVLLEYTPLAGSVGEKSQTEVSIRPRGDLARATA